MRLYSRWAFGVCFGCVYYLSQPNTMFPCLPRICLEGCAGRSPGMLSICSCLCVFCTGGLPAPPQPPHLGTHPSNVDRLWPWQRSRMALLCVSAGTSAHQSLTFYKLSCICTLMLSHKLLEVRNYVFLTTILSIPKPEPDTQEVCDKCLGTYK